MKNLFLRVAIVFWIIAFSGPCLAQSMNDPGGTYDPAIDRQNQQLDRETMSIKEDQIKKLPADAQDQVRQHKKEATMRQLDHMQKGTMK